MPLQYKKLGNYIREVDVKNTDLKVSLLLGVSITKKFIPSIANIIGTDLSKYKIVRKGQFAYVPVTSRNGDQVSIALLEDNECIISTSYTVFEISKPEELLNEYLMLLFSNPEFDRYARYNSWGSAREIFSWDELCNTELYIPDIEEQKRIVREYQVIEKRIIALNKQNIILERLINTEYKNLFSEKEQAIESTDILGNITSTIDNRGKTPPNTEQVTEFPLLEIAALKTDGRVISYENCEKYVSEKTYQTWFRSGHPQKYDILFSTVGSIAKFKIFLREKGCIAQNIVAFRCKKQELGLYLYEQLNEKIEEILSYEIGSVQASIKVSQIINLPIDIPKKEVLDQFNKLAVPLTKLISSNATEIELNRKTLKMILQKLS